MKTISVLVVDDHPIVRDGLDALISSTKGMRVFGLAADGNEAVKMCAVNEPPDAVLMDIRMPGKDGFETLKSLKTVHPSMRVLLMAGMPLQVEVDKAKAIGAAGYIPKSSDRNRIISALRTIVEKRDAFVQDEVPAGTGSILSPRELQILTLLSTGHTREDIALCLGIGEETVKTHVKKIFLKLDAPSSVAAVGRAYELGILRA